MIKQNTDDRFDFDLSQETRILDREGINDKMELDSIDMLEQCLNSKVELKHHDATMTTNNLCIEYMIDKHGTGQYLPSGLSKTEAGHWVFNIGTAVLFLEVEFIKWVCRQHKRFNLKTKPPRGAKKYISKNFLINFGAIPFLLGKYQEEVLDKPLTYE